MQPGRYLNDFLDFVPQFKQRFPKRDFEIVMGMAVGAAGSGNVSQTPTDADADAGAAPNSGKLLIDATAVTSVIAR